MKRWGTTADVSPGPDGRHHYSNKAPGSSMLAIPGYLVLHGKQGKILHKIEHGVATVVDVLLSKQAEMRAQDGGAPAARGRRAAHGMTPADSGYGAGVLEPGERSGADRLVHQRAAPSTSQASPGAGRTGVRKMVVAAPTTGTSPDVSRTSVA